MSIKSECNTSDISIPVDKILAAELQTKFWGCFSWIWESNRRHRRHRRLMETKESIRRWGNLGDDGIIQRRSIGDKGIQRRLQDSLSIEFFLLLYLYYIIYKGMSNNILYIGASPENLGAGKNFGVCRVLFHALGKEVKPYIHTYEYYILTQANG